MVLIVESWLGVYLTTAFGKVFTPPEARAQVQLRRMLESEGIVEVADGSYVACHAMSVPLTLSTPKHWLPETPSAPHRLLYTVYVPV